MGKRLDEFMPNVQIVESKAGIKIMAPVPVDAGVIDKFVLEDTKPLEFRCGYVGDCKDRFNGWCGFKGKWCSQRVKE